MSDEKHPEPQPGSGDRRHEDAAWSEPASHPDVGSEPGRPHEESAGVHDMLDEDPAPTADAPTDDHAEAAAAPDRGRDSELFYEDDLVEGAYIEHDEDGTALLISSSTYGRGYQTVTPMEGGASRAILHKRRRRRRRRTLGVAAVLGGLALMLVILLVVVESLFGGMFGGPEDYDTQAGDSVTFTVEGGEGWDAVAARLEDQGIIASSEAFIDALQDSEDLGTLQSGEYELREEMPAEDALSAIVPDRDAQHYVAINVGSRLDAALESISEATGIEEDELRDAAEDPTDYGLPEQALTLEGFLAAGEYRFDLEAEPEEMLQEMVDRTFERLEDDGVTDSDEQFERIIVASLLTAEALPDDYRTVAGIIENRLNPENDETDGLLQIDATVIYGLGEQSLQFTEEERQDSDNEFNTYVHEGLPPGPIEAPASEAIDAAADPEENDYYYWLTVNIETGETKFAEDYSEHQVYWQEFRDYCADNPDICTGEAADQVPDVEEIEEDDEGDQ
ncbi:endolytic transglycosylase MltG [Nesterenkonia marinintestina]|uniref:endolytic transglycosylase MltG n=1 Tax=Nesterenkonia marinintestina TaxID=2979865 RepID=UPI0021C0813F|nr:endolytic transglycosylase MltG [Nesterenkonia sp. GX14115]